MKMNLAAQLNWERLWQLVKREIKQRYKDTVLGVVWIVLAPIIQALAISFILVRVIGVNSAIPAALFPFIVLSGFLVWNFIARTVGHALSTFTNNRELVINQHIPLALLPLSQTIVKLIDYLVELVVLIILLFIVNQPITWSFLGLLPLTFALFLFTCGLSFIFSTAYIVIRDTGHLMSFILSIWFWLSPVFYPSDIIPKALSILNFNPVVHFLFAARQMLFYNLVDPVKLAKILVMSAIVFVVGIVFFERVKPKIYDSV